MKIRVKLQEFLIIVLCVLMPFHSIFFAITKLNALVLWRDILLIFLILIILYMNSFKISISTESVIIFISVIVCIVHALMTHDKSMPPSIWVNSLRIYLLPFLAYYIGFEGIFNSKIYISIKNIYIYSAVTISIWGIYQMFFLGVPFLYKIGYGVSSAVLANGFQRNVGVFSSANLMGMYLVIALLILLYGDIQMKFKKTFIFFLLISLALTLSTSSILGFICCIIFNRIRKIEVKKFITLHKNIIKNIFYIMVMAIMAMVVDQVVLSGKILELASDRLEELFNALTFAGGRNTTSASIHLNDLVQSFNLMKDNLGGVGFSTSSFILLGRVSDARMTNSVESSIFTILFDFGLIGGIFYLLPFLYPIVAAVRKKDQRNIACLVMLALIVLYIFLPLVSSIELRFFAFLFLGLECNKRYKRVKKMVV